MADRQTAPAAERPKQWAKARAGYERTRCIIQRRAGRPITIAENIVDAEAHNLIAAAPEMYEALKGYIAHTAASAHPGVPIQEALRAIAKAEGK